MKNKRNLSKKTSFLWMLVFGLLGAFTYLVQLMYQNEYLSIIVNFIAMLGSGVFCSALVSICFEKISSERRREEQDEKKEYIFSYLSFCLKNAILEELIQTSKYEGIGYTQECTIEEGIKINEAITRLIKTYKGISEKKSKIDCELDQKLNDLIDNTAAEYEYIKNAANAIISQSMLLMTADIIDEDCCDCLMNLRRFSNYIFNHSDRSELRVLVLIKLRFLQSSLRMVELLESDFEMTSLNFKILD